MTKILQLNDFTAEPNKVREILTWNWPLQCAFFLLTGSDHTFNLPRSVLDAHR